MLQSHIVLDEPFGDAIDHEIHRSLITIWMVEVVGHVVDLLKSEWELALGLEVEFALEFVFKVLHLILLGEVEEIGGLEEAAEFSIFARRNHTFKLDVDVLDVLETVAIAAC